MAIRDLAGTGALQDSLATTNEHLEAVLGQLQETNSQRLGEVATEVRQLGQKLDRVIELLEAQSQ